MHCPLIGNCEPILQNSGQGSSQICENVTKTLFSIMRSISSNVCVRACVSVCVCSCMRHKDHSNINNKAPERPAYLNFIKSGSTSYRSDETKLNDGRRTERRHNN